MAINYTQEQVDFMKNTYSDEPTRATVLELADELDKSVKSIIGKLSREGVYKKTEYVTKTGEKPVTKSQLVLSIAEELNEDYESLSGLEKSPKEALKVLLYSIEEIKLGEI